MLTVRRLKNTLEVTVRHAVIDDDLHVRLQRNNLKHSLFFSAIQNPEGVFVRFDVRGHLSLGEILFEQQAKSSVKELLHRILEAGCYLFDQQLAFWPKLFFAGTIFIDRHSGVVRFPLLPVDAPDPDGLFLPIFTQMMKTGELSGAISESLEQALLKDRLEEASLLIAPAKADLTVSEKPSVYKLLQMASEPIARLKAQVHSLFDAEEEEEITRPLSGGELLRIAMISEGAVGTRAEIEGEKAYILVDEFLLGRDSNKADFHLDDPSCGRLHARILRRRELFFLEDLGSKNGTYVDGQRLAKHRETMLPDSCKLTFGDLAYYFTIE